MIFNWLEHEAPDSQLRYSHAIRIFGHDGEFIPRIVWFDTETMLYRIMDMQGRCGTAAGFCFVSDTLDHYQNWLCYHIPSGLLPFVVKMPTHPFPNDEAVRADITKQWIKQYLDRLPPVP